MAEKISCRSSCVPRVRLVRIRALAWVMFLSPIGNKLIRRRFGRRRDARLRLDYEQQRPQLLPEKVADVERKRCFVGSQGRVGPDCTAGEVFACRGLSLEASPAQSNSEHWVHSDSEYGTLRCCAIRDGGEACKAVGLPLAKESGGKPAPPHLV
jgi:hypothetical protein